MATSKKQKISIQVLKGGPYIVSGALPLSKEIIRCGADGQPEKWAKAGKLPGKKTCALCRCGESSGKPYCDGSHAKSRFAGTETASRKSFAECAQVTKGGAIDLLDVPELCAGMRFCHSGGGTWNLASRSADPKCKKLAIKEACNCASGRLVARDKKTGKAIEQRLKQSISLVEDPQANVSGPLWVKGGVPIISCDGKQYEIRNRVTLCRCGKSTNKPFCDGSHIAAEFNDGDKSLPRNRRK